MGRIVETLAAPPLGACHYGCGSSCAAPVTVIWLFGLTCIVSGFFGGPTDAKGLSWMSIGAGFLMWLFAAIWALATQAFGHAACGRNRRARN